MSSIVNQYTQQLRQLKLLLQSLGVKPREFNSKPSIYSRWDHKEMSFHRKEYDLFPGLTWYSFDFYDHRESPYVLVYYKTSIMDPGKYVYEMAKLSKDEFAQALKLFLRDLKSVKESKPEDFTTQLVDKKMYVHFLAHRVFPLASTKQAVEAEVDSKVSQLKANNQHLSQKLSQLKVSHQEKLALKKKALEEKSKELEIEELKSRLKQLTKQLKRLEDVLDQEYELANLKKSIEDYESKIGQEGREIGRIINDLVKVLPNEKERGDLYDRLEKKYEAKNR